MIRRLRIRKRRSPELSLWRRLTEYEPEERRPGETERAFRYRMITEVERAAARREEAA